MAPRAEQGDGILEGAVQRRWPLVGRQSELEAFELALRDDRRQGLVLYGPAGTGKSRLADSCLKLAKRAKHPTGRAVATQAAAKLPLGAIAHLLPADVDLSDPVAGFAAAVRTMARSAKPRPVWLIDDAHLLDTTSATLLGQLIDAEALFLLATVRSGEAKSEAVAALERGDAVQRVDLTDLTLDAVESLLHTVLGPLRAAASQELYRLSVGNALFLRELVDGALRGGALVKEGEVWDLALDKFLGTARLRERVQARLVAAGHEGLPVLELLAVCGPVALTDATAEAASAGGESVLIGLERLGLTSVSRQGGRASVDLAHPLYGEVLRETIPQLRRRAMQIRQAERIERHGQRRREDPVHVALWRLAATGVADPATLVSAAAVARNARDYVQVIELLSALPPEYQTVDSRCLLGEAYAERCQYGAAEAILERAQRQAVTEGERFSVLLQRTYLLWGMGRLHEALELCEAGREGLRSPMPQRTLDVHEGGIRCFAGEDPEVVQGYFSDIDSVANERVRLTSKLYQALAIRAQGRLSDAIRMAEGTYKDHMQSQIAQFPALQMIPLSLALSDRGELKRAANIARDSLEASIVGGATVPQIWLTYSLARNAWLAGHVTQSRRWYLDLLLLARKHRPSVARVAASGAAACAALLGDFPAAEALVTDLECYPKVGIFAGEEILGQVWLLATRGNLPEARELLTDVATRLRKQGQVAGEVLLLTEAARLGGAAEVADRMTELAKHCDGDFTLTRAEFAVAIAARDPEALILVADQFEAIGADLLAAEAATTASDLWNREHEPRRAAAAAVRARAAAKRCEGVQSPGLMVAPNAKPLTSREREIALLAAAGSSSRDIASKLQLSVRTVSNHLQRAYSKLGVDSRVGLTDSLRNGNL